MSSTVLLTLMTLVLSGAPHQADLATPGEAVAAAWAQLERGATATAEERFREILASYPSATEAREGLAEALAAQGRAAEAVDLLVETGARLHGEGRHREAMPLLERAVHLDPQRQSAHYFLGASLEAIESYERAIEHFRATIELGDRQIAARLGLAEALWESGRLDASEEQYRAALERYGPDPIALHQLAQLLLFRGRYGEAAGLITTALERVEPSPQLLLDLSRSLERTGATAEAVTAAEDALELAPEDPRVRYQLGTALLADGRPDEAEPHLDAYRQLSERAEKERRANRRLDAALAEAESLWSAGRLEELVRLLAEIPPTARGLELAVAALARLERTDDAVTLLERLIELQPERPELNAWLERLRRRREANGRPETANR